MWNGTRAVLAAVLWLTVCAGGAAQAEDLAPGCAEEGDGLVPAIEELSPRELETLAGRLLGPDIAGLVRRAPWDAVWQGTSRDEAPYFIQGPGKEPRLPPVRFDLAAPPPLRLEAELRLQPGTECLAFDVPRDFRREVSPEEGEVTLRAPMRVQLTLSVAGFSKRWELPATEVSVHWTHDDPEGTLLTRFFVGDLKFGLPAPGAKESVSTTWDTLRWDRELAGWTGPLVRSLSVPGPHRERVATLLGTLGARSLRGADWERLRQLQAAGVLKSGEVQRLGLLARQPTAVPADKASVFVYQEGVASTPPSLFVAGREVTGWTRVGEQQHELRVPLAGLVAVRAEFGERGGTQSFATVLGAGVRIRLAGEWGPLDQAKLAGPRCGLVRDAASAPCGHGPEGRAPIGRLFDLDATCGGGPAYAASAIEYGEEGLVPTLPGLYVRDREQGLTFDPTYGGRRSPPATCGQP